MPLRRSAVIAALTCLAAAAAAPVHAIEAGDPHPPTVGGVPVYPADSPNSPYNPVTQTGRVDTLGNSSPFSGVGVISGGSGVLIDSTHVLTAGHLFDPLPANPGNVNFTLRYDDGTGMADHVFLASSIARDPLYHGVNGNDSNDLSVVTLSTPVPGFIHTYGLYTGPLSEGTIFTLTGFGDTGDGINGYGAGIFARRVGKVTADAFLVPSGSDFVYATTYTPGDQTYDYEFHSPVGSPNPAPDYLPGVSLGNNVETNIGGGDSGSPAFVFINGQYEIAALNNFTDRFDGAKDSSGNYLPSDGKFGTGGGGPIISGYTDAGGVLAPYAAPEPSPLAAFSVGVLGLLGSAARRRKISARQA